VVFANRYIHAYEQFIRGERTTVSWLLAFDAARRNDLTVTQHLVLGMNAHINLDLGIAAAEVAPAGSISAIANDFLRINGMLAAMMSSVEALIGEVSPGMGRLTETANALDDFDQRVGTFSIETARAGAWRFALRLNQITNPLARQMVITARDAATAAVGVAFQKPNPLRNVLGAESTDIAAHIRVLSRISQV
jgi:hypothetical protein